MDFAIPIIVGASAVAGIAVIAPATKFALDMSPYLYANTRTSARAGLILKKKDYEEILAATSINEVFALLEDTYYSYAIEHAKDFDSLSRLLDKDLYNTYKWLVNVVPSSLKPLFKSFLLKFEINEIKEVIGKIKNNEAVGELEYIQDSELKIKLGGVKDLSSFNSVIEGTDYEKIFTNKNINEMSSAITALDKMFIETIVTKMSLVKDNGAILPFKEYWKTIIDLTNIRLALRKENSKSEELGFIDGGLIKISDLSGINDLSQLESVLSSSVYAEFISEYNGFSIENGIYKFLLKQAGNIAGKYTLKSGALVKFILLKELEIRNLNIAVKLKSENFKADYIEKILVV